MFDKANAGSPLGGDRNGNRQQKSDSVFPLTHCRTERMAQTLSPLLSSRGEFMILRWTAIFFVIAFISAAIGGYEVAQGAMEIGQILLLIFLVLFAGTLLLRQCACRGGTWFWWECRHCRKKNDGSTLAISSQPYSKKDSHPLDVIYRSAGAHMNNEKTPNPSMMELKKHRLVNELRSIVLDADDLLNAVATSTTEEFTAVRNNIESRLDEARHKLDSARSVISSKARCTVDATEAYVKENPWKAVGLTAAVGFIIFTLLNRR